jgi:hypothetical protein
MTDIREYINSDDIAVAAFFTTHALQKTDDSMDKYCKRRVLMQQERT